MPRTNIQEKNCNCLPKTFKKDRVAMKKSMKKKRTRRVSENVTNFVRAIVEKKYSAADKYLTAELEAKLAARISENF